MDDARLGRTVRALRLRLNLRQRDAAARAGVPQSTWSLVERGFVSRLQVHTVRTIVEAVGGEWSPGVRWRGGDLDRLLDEGHAELVGVVVGLLERWGWQPRVEVTYSIYGERGSIDVLAFHPLARVLLVVEVKTSLVSVEETIRRHDAKVRLAPSIAADRFQWRDVVVARLLVLPASVTARRRVARQRAVIGHAYRSTGWELRRWLRSPTAVGAVVRSGLLFVSPSVRDAGRRSTTAPRRVRPRTGRPRCPEK